MTYLISINKPHTDNIFSHKKTIEWRKKKLPDGIYRVYETKNKGGCGAVLGMFIIDNGMSDFSCANSYSYSYVVSTYAGIRELSDETIKEGCVDKPFLEKYIGKDSGKLLWGNRIKAPIKFEKPIPITEYVNEKGETIKRPPQFYMRCKNISKSS